LAQADVAATIAEIDRKIARLEASNSSAQEAVDRARKELEDLGIEVEDTPQSRARLKEQYDELQQEQEAAENDLEAALAEATQWMQDNP